MIWGVDTATILTGITAGTGADEPAVGVWEFEHCGEDLGHLLEQFDARLTRLAEQRPPSVILYEAPILKKFDALLKLRKLYSMGAYLELFGRRMGARVEEVSAKAMKKALTGNHEADKALMVAVCRRLGLRLPTGEGAKDAADSFAAWYVGVRLHAPEHAARWDTAIQQVRGGLL